MPFFDSRKPLKGNAEAFEGIAVVSIVQVPGAQALGEEFARLSGYALEDTPYASGFAGYKDWFIKVWRRPGFTIEAGLGENPLPISQFDTIYAKNLGILTTAALGLPA